MNKDRTIVTRTFLKYNQDLTFLAKTMTISRQLCNISQ